MTKLEKPIESFATITKSDALAMIADPSRIESPNGWGEFLPDEGPILEEGRHFCISGTTMHETDNHSVTLIVDMPSFANEALSKLFRKTKSKCFCGNISNR